MGQEKGNKIQDSFIIYWDRLGNSIGTQNWKTLTNAFLQFLFSLKKILALVSMPTIACLYVCVLVCLGCCKEILHTKCLKHQKCYFLRVLEARGPRSRFWLIQLLEETPFSLQTAALSLYPHMALPQCICGMRVPLCLLLLWFELT